MRNQDLKENQVVHCANKEEAIRVCKLAHDAELNWGGKKSYLDHNHYEDYKENICYNFK